MSIQGVASPVYTFTPPKRNSLTHIPGDEGWPIIGKTLYVLAAQDAPPAWEARCPS